MENYSEAVVFAVLPTLIYVTAWVVVLVFAVKMVRSDGGRPERFLLIGASLMLAGSLVSSAVTGLNPWLVFKLTEAGTDRVGIAGVFGAINIFRACISLAGIIFLVYAFWQKFKARPSATMSD